MDRTGHCCAPLCEVIWHNVIVNFDWSVNNAFLVLLVLSGVDNVSVIFSLSVLEFLVTFSFSCLFGYADF